MIKLGENNITAIYQGDTLIFYVFKDGEIIHEAPFIIEGKFTDDSTADDWWANIPTKTDISYCVDPNTKEFKFASNTIPSGLSSLFNSNTAIERIDRIKCNSTNIGYSSMFSKCSSLKYVNLSELKLPPNSNCQSMFEQCTNLEQIDPPILFDNAQIKIIYRMFSSCINLKSIKLGENFVGEGCANLSYMFNACRSLESIELPKCDASNIQGLSDIIDTCTSLKTFDMRGISTSKVYDWSRMCTSSVNLHTVKANFDFSSTTNNIGSKLFDNCPSLTNFIGSVSNLSVSVDLHYSPLTNESAMIWINGLADVEETQTITFSSQTYNTLTEEQIAIATAKGWTVVSA